MNVLASRLLKSTMIAVAVTFVVVSFAVPRAQRSEGPTGPSAWVAFTAEMVRTTPAGNTYGRLYRGADGSSRLETGPTPTDMKLIDIKNVTEESTYYYAEEIGWKKHPMQLDGRGFPLQIRPSRMARETGVAIRYENLDALSVTQPGGRTEVHIPALNFFVADSSRPNGTRMRYSNIQIGSVNAGLFVPPPGAVVTYDSEPAGIIRTSPEEVQKILEATKKPPYGRR